MKQKIDQPVDPAGTADSPIFGAHQCLLESKYTQPTAEYHSGKTT